MTDINEILDANWDITICAKPTFIKIHSANYRMYQRVIASTTLGVNDEIIGTVRRRNYSPEANDAYTVILASCVSLTDLMNIKKAFLKVCVTYQPSSEENIIQYDVGEMRVFNNYWFEIKFTVYVRKVGVSAF